MVQQRIEKDKRIRIKMLDVAIQLVKRNALLRISCEEAATQLDQIITDEFGRPAPSFDDRSSSIGGATDSGNESPSAGSMR